MYKNLRKRRVIVPNRLAKHFNCSAGQPTHLANSTFQIILILFLIVSSACLMGNALAHFPRRLRVLLHAPTSSRIECYDAEAENELRHSNSSSGFRIGSAGRHDALMHTRNLRGACSSNFSSSQKADPVCVVNICTSCQELADYVLASDVQYKSVALIGNMTLNDFL